MRMSEISQKKFFFSKKKGGIMSLLYTLMFGPLVAPTLNVKARLDPSLSSLIC